MEGRVDIEAGHFRMILHRQMARVHQLSGLLEVGRPPPSRALGNAGLALHCSGHVSAFPANTHHPLLTYDPERY